MVLKSLSEFSFVEDDRFGVARGALLEVLGIDSSPGTTIIGEIVDKDLRAVPEFHAIEHFEENSLSFPTDTMAHLIVFIEDERDERVCLELIKIENQLVHPDVLQEQTRDNLGLHLYEWLKLDLIVLKDWGLRGGRRCVCLGPLPTGLHHGRTRADAPGVIEVLEDAEVFVLAKFSHWRLNLRFSAVRCFYDFRVSS